MRRSNALGNAVMATVLGAVVMAAAGCTHNNPKSGGGYGLNRHYPHNLAHLHCGNNHTPENYAIEVAANQQVLVKPDDAIVFVCEGDMVSWFTQGANTLIRINFADSYADDLLGAGHSKFEKKHETDKQTVHDQTGHRGRVYKYSITVDDGNGSTFTLDPHVIPMGK
jgi:hypothetical protein